MNVITPQHNVAERAEFTCSVVICCVLVLSSTTARSEDLTTLDGKTYSNIDYLTNYPNQIILNYKGERVWVAISNLPVEFRTKHGIAAITNKPKVSANIPVRSEINPTDLFLLQNRDSDLYQLESDYFSTNDSIGIGTSKSWFVGVRNGQIDLTAWTTISYHSPKLSDTKRSDQMHLELGQEDLVSRILNKFIEWDGIAATNHAENFKKELARRPVSQAGMSDLFMNGNVCIYTFVWQDGSSGLQVDDADVRYSGSFEKDDILRFQTLLTHVPEMKQKLATAIRNRETQKDLFK